MTRPVKPYAIAARRLLAAVLLVASARLCPAQEQRPTSISDELLRIGVFGGTQWIDYSADLVGLPGVPSCCPRYQSGSGSGLALGLSIENRFLPRLSGGFRILFARYRGTLEATERELVTAERDTQTAVFGHTIEVSQPALAAELNAAYETLPGLSVTAGARADFMLGGTYSQREEIISPGTIRFENDQRQRMLSSGSIPQETSTHIALIAGVRYDVPLNSARTLLLSPAVQIWQGLSDLVGGEAWKMRGVQVGLNLYLVQRPAMPEQLPVPEKIEPPKPAQPEPPKVEPPKPEPEPETPTGAPTGPRSRK